MPTNSAAWILAAKAPLEVKEAPYPTAGPKDVIIKTAAVAINPLKYKIQDSNPPIGGKEIQYPTILGADLSGTIVEICEEVSTRNVGDRVIANANGTQSGQPARSAFQQFVQLVESNTTPLPESIALEAAAAGLFVPDQLGLHTGRLGSATNSNAPGPGSVLLVWGGSSSVGCCALQMAKAAGYEVYTTASKRNHDLCTSIGAIKVFDHSHIDVQDQIVSALEGKTIVGVYDAIVDKEKSFLTSARILAKANRQKMITAVLNPPEIDLPQGVQAQRLSIPALRAGPVYNIVHNWMANALANSTLKPRPDPEVIGEGLDFVQAGIDKVRQGVSAAKVVIKM
ncbi:Putative GroES-like superfamily, alcohol dehydrogenase-like, NAD(P)-binding domain superfamily [Septoria linicola]|uniref:GroES-like superfamily, alcohol dehydrogenase-like, NAD(P)-binding domain superfamily n=1 Tax=Septoria linicola TaxID=215465 RepID=A0A9Q9AN58_9PEZI|nr:putative GroES-like superfamily, alcohol dehydrogenase-like, NAD(P)-binding domain superfamily [Septoria linicola]USW52552.1 Putative GroES-like superfamily, alcohol dehydrogenase-like, NAD(P)-binding domain superfamily [Septoria linicola]